MESNLTGCVDSHRPGRLVSKEARGRAVIHELERLVFAAIETAGSVPLEDVLLELLHILRDGGAGQDRWSRWGYFTAGTGVL